MAGAANIVSSTLTSYAQKDGRHTAVELHTDLVSVVHQLVYLAEAAADLSANLAVHATRIGVDLDAREVAANIALVSTIGSIAAPTFIYSTPSANASSLRAAYRDMTQVQAIMTGDYLNTLTDTQISNAFGITLTQAQTLRTNTLAPAAAQAAAIRAAAGQ